MTRPLLNYINDWFPPHSHLSIFATLFPFSFLFSLLFFRFCTGILHFLYSSRPSINHQPSAIDHPRIISYLITPASTIHNPRLRHHYYCVIHSSPSLSFLYLVSISQCFCLFPL